MIKWPKDITAAKMVFYGDFHKKDFQAKMLVRIKPSFPMYYDGKTMPSGILVNKMCASAMLAALNEVYEKCEHNPARVKATGAADFGGCFNIRSIAGSNNYSNHSWACAIDLSPKTNGFNMKGTLSLIVVEAFKRQGARWGGDYKNRKDPMHFEFVS